MNLARLSYYLVLVVFLSSCNKQEAEEELIETCVEGWVDIEDSSTIYFEKCPQRLTNCTKTFRLYINVLQFWPDGAGTLTVRNINNGVVEEFSRELLLYRHREQIIMNHDRRYNFTHEVTVDLPSDRCEVNGQKYRYTFEIDIPCDGYADLAFDICDP